MNTSKQPWWLVKFIAAYDYINGLYNSSYDYIFNSGCIYVILVFVLVACGYILYINRQKFLNLDKFFSSILEKFNSIEEDFSTFDDSFFFIALYFLLFTMFFYVFMYYIFHTHWVLVILIPLLSLVLTISILSPVTVWVQRKVFFCNYLRGVAKTENTWVESALDFLACGIIAIRLVLQNIRYIIILYMFYEVLEYSYFSSEFCASVTALLNSWFVPVSWDYPMLILINSISLLCSIVFYFFHYIGFYVMQATVFFLISFWLVSYFYVSYILAKTEKIHWYKKYEICIE